MQELDRLDIVIKDLEANAEELGDLKKMYSELRKLGDALSQLDSRIRSNESLLNEATKELNNEQTRLSRIVNDFSEENRAKLDQYDKQLSSRLERFSSDITVEIRQGIDRNNIAFKQDIEGTKVALENQVSAKFSAIRSEVRLWSMAAVGATVAVFLYLLLR